MRRWLGLVVVVLSSAVLGPSSAVANGPIRKLIGRGQQSQSVSYASSTAYAGNGYAYASSSSFSSSPSDVGVGTAAWAQARREAELQARRGRVGHILGVAPGAGMQGVGSSFSGSHPNHCTGRGLIARAGVQGADGKWYFSAAYARP